MWELGGNKFSQYRVERIDGSDPEEFLVLFRNPGTGPSQPALHTTEPLVEWELRQLLNEMGVDPVDVDRDIRRARQPAM